MKKLYRPLTYSIVFAILLGLIYSGCSREKKVTISEIQTNPEKYKDKTIKVKGKVTKSFKESIYQISKDENSLWIKPAEEMPQEGKEVEVCGEIITGVAIEDKTYGIVLVEKIIPPEKKVSEEK